MMQRWGRITPSLAVVLLASASAPAATPKVLGYQGRLLTSTGAPVQAGIVDVRFAIFASAEGADELWHEEQQLALTQGFYATFLGEKSALPSSVFAGGDRWLELQVEGEPMSPRQRIGSVLYSMRAAEAESVAGGLVDASSVAVGGATVIDSAGRLAGTARYRAGSGLTIDDGSQTVAIASCANGQIMKWDGSGWACSEDGGATCEAAAGGGLVLQDGKFALTDTCGAGQVLKWQGSAWGCSDDGGNVYEAAAGGGLVLRSGRFALSSECAVGQMLKWDGTAWACSADAANPGTVTSVSASGPLSVANATTTPTLTLARCGPARDGYLAATDFSAFQSKLDEVTVAAGSGLQGAGLAGAPLSLLRACDDGAVLKWDRPSQAWKCAVDDASPGTVTSVSVAAPLAVANPTTQPAITLPRAGAAADGYLAKGDWTAFAAKLDASSPAGGDVTGPYSSLVVGRLQGRAVASTAPTSGQVLRFNGSMWAPADDRREQLTVKDFGAVGDGVADDTAALRAAVSSARAAGADLEWPAGVYFTTASIAGLHEVRHRGPGVIAAGAVTRFAPAPGDAQANVLHVSPSGDDANDGITAARALRQISTAARLLANYGPVLRGSWTIRPQAGTYSGGIAVPRNLQSRDFIKIAGPGTGGHPNVPTVIVDKAADAAHTYGISATDGILLWLQDLKITGAFEQGVLVARNVYLQYRNVHVDGAVTGLQVNTHSRYFVTGGIIENCGTGINELFHISRDFGTVGSASEQIVLRNNGIGLKAKENCVGHSDYINFEGNGTGMELHLFSGTNPKGAVFKRNGVGILLANSEIHNENAIVWGTGPDANGRRLLSLGNSSEVASFGWDMDNSIRTGHRPLLLLFSDYADHLTTGTTAESPVASTATILPADVYAVKGKKYRVQIKGRVPAGVTLAADARILLRVAGTYMTDVTVPAGTNGAQFVAEFETVCTADGNNQLVSSWVMTNGQPVRVTNIRRTANMTDADRGVAVSVMLGAAADQLMVHAVEVSG